MPRRSRTKKIKRLLTSLPAMVILAVLVVVVGVAAWDMYQTSRETNETVTRLENKKQELADRKRAASSAAAELSTRRGIEEEIREKFSVAKPDEKVVVLVDNRNSQATSTQEEQSWWGSIWSSVQFW